MVRIMYDVTTRIHIEKYGELFTHNDIKELEQWLLKNIGQPHEDWQPSLDHRGYVCVAVPTRDQQTFTALRWA